MAQAHDKCTKLFMNNYKVRNDSPFIIIRLISVADNERGIDLFL